MTIVLSKSRLAVDELIKKLDISEEEIREGGDKWMKICQTCGLSVEDTDRQCPNCGSYDLRSDNKEQFENVDVRLRRFK
ncbi:hypothetical protein KKE60_06170 [Patescibacteria group bacterium]|nr:hypothetical protein [Patescibacteria group bacterium]